MYVHSVVCTDIGQRGSQRVLARIACLWSGPPPPPVSPVQEDTIIRGGERTTEDARVFSFTHNKHFDISVRKTTWTFFQSHRKHVKKVFALQQKIHVTFRATVMYTKVTTLITLLDRADVNECPREGVVVKLVKLPTLVNNL